MINIIRPDQGRVVEFWPRHTDEGIVDPRHPFTATIAFAHHGREVNLAITDHYGRRFHMERVLLVQPDAYPFDATEVTRYATWPARVLVQARNISHVHPMHGNNPDGLPFGPAPTNAPRSTSDPLPGALAAACGTPQPGGNVYNLGGEPAGD